MNVVETDVQSNRCFVNVYPDLKRENKAQLKFN